MKAILPPQKATLTGIETEGPLTGEIVCSEIVLWKINKKTHFRVRSKTKLPHGPAVTVDKTTENSSGEVLFHVRGPHCEGWVTGRFLEYG